MYPPSASVFITSFALRVETLHRAATKRASIREERLSRRNISRTVLAGKPAICTPLICIVMGKDGNATQRACQLLNRWSFPTAPVLRTAQSSCDSLGTHLNWVQLGPVLGSFFGVKRCRINGSF